MFKNLFQLSQLFSVNFAKHFLENLFIVNKSQDRERKRGGEKGAEGEGEGGREKEREEGKEKTGDCRRKPPAHTEKMTSIRFDLNFYPSHFLPKKCSFTHPFFFLCLPFMA